MNPSAGPARARQFPGAPDQASNEADAVGIRSSAVLAREIVEFHRKGLQKRRFSDLTREKYLLHIDGEGLSQFLDLFDGERLAIPYSVSNMPLMQDNLLRPVVDHMVAYHTAQQFAFVSEPKDDRRDRERSLVDQIWINHLAVKQRLNTVVAAALYMGCGYGHAPLHAYWRNDSISDVYEPLKSGPDEMAQPGQGQMLQFPEPPRGMIDFFVGDPFSTVYHGGSKRTSVPMYTYERVLPAEMVRNAFQHVEGVDKLEGSDKLPSVSRYVRTVRNWNINSAFVHGFGGMIDGAGNDELLSCIFQEIPPNIDPRLPEGRLRLIAMNGSAEFSREGDSRRGDPLVLHDGPLPGGCLSSVRLYTMPGGRQDDVHGKPFVADLDDDQMELNQALTERKMYLLRATRSPLITEEAFDQETDVWETDSQLELEPGTQTAPYFLEAPHRHIAALSDHINDLRNSLFTKAGYQAASRGESRSGDSAAKVVALARLDDTVHGPTNLRMREDLEDFMGIAWNLMHQYGDVPWIVDNIGAEHAHIVGRYVDRTQLSKSPPSIRLVSGFGATPEARAEQLLRMVQMRGADGEVLMSSRQFRAAWPDKTLYPEAEDPMGIRERRPKVINAEIRRQTEEMLQKMQQQGARPEIMEMFAPAMEEAIHSIYPVLPDDIMPLHIQELGNITQDETENRIVRRVAGLRQNRYRALIQQMQLQAQARAQAEEDKDTDEPKGAASPRRGQAQGEQSTAKARPSQVAQLTREAQGAA